MDTQQALVLAEIRCLLLFLGCEIGLLLPSFAEAMMKTTFCSEVGTLADPGLDRLLPLTPHPGLYPGLKLLLSLTPTCHHPAGG